jgi:hypothetical protein
VVSDCRYSLYYDKTCQLKMSHYGEHKIFLPLIPKKEVLFPLDRLKMACFWDILFEECKEFSHLRHGIYQGNITRLTGTSSHRECLLSAYFAGSPQKMANIIGKLKLLLYLLVTFWGYCYSLNIGLR